MSHATQEIYRKNKIKKKNLNTYLWHSLLQHATKYKQINKNVEKINYALWQEHELDVKAASRIFQLKNI